MAATKLEWFNRLVPEEYRSDPTRRNQATILLAVILFNNLYCMISLLFVRYGLSALDPQIRQVGYQLIFIGMFSYLVALICYYKWRKLPLAAHLVVFGLFSSSVSSLFVTGGYMESPLPVLVVLAPTFAFLLIGLRSGITWSALCMSTLIIMWVFEQKQLLVFQQLLTDPAIKRNLTLWIPMTVGVMVIAAMIIYETITMRLRAELHAEKNKFKWDATHDALTGLPNRPEFFHRLELGIRNAEVNNQSLALMYIDLDGFKPINDTLGHHAGDEVLKVISKRMQSIVRGSDCVARLGGDEFAVILQGVNTNHDTMDIILNKTLKTISDKMIIDGREVSVSASIGVVYYDGKDGAINDLCRKADIAMYKAKEQKNTWCLYGKA